MSSRRIVALLLPVFDGESARPASFLEAASDLARQIDGELHVVEISPAASDVPDDLRARLAMTSWTQFVHPGASPLDVDALVALTAAALTSETAGRERHLCLLPPGPPMDEVQARVAARLGACALGHCASLALDGDAVVAHRPAWSGRVEMLVRCTSAGVFALWRGPSAQGAAAAGDSPRRLRYRAQSLEMTLPHAQEIELLPVEDRAPPLEGARIVVSGGRGMGGQEGFELLSRLARHLGAAVGGSLPTIDAGWLPVARQIGQSGKFVHPRLYFAVGISGTPQHLAGISTETAIIAVNKDPEAPIFGVAEVGVVADWRDVLPALLDQLQESPPV